MRWYLIVVGGGLVALAIWETVVTVLTTGAGGGPLTDRIGRILWRIGLRLHRPRSRGRYLQMWGVGIVAATPLVWVVLLLAGWTLVFNGGPQAVVHATSERPAGGFEHLYFVGYTALTLGNGEFKPNGSVWQMATVLVNLNGLFLVTLAVTYLVPVVQAATDRRRLARTIAALGCTPQDIVGEFWGQGKLSGLAALSQQLVADVQLMAERHLTYPVLYYYHEREARAALLPRLGALYDALLIALGGLEPGQVDSRERLRTLQRSLHEFVQTFPGHHVRELEDPPPLPDVDGLVDRGVPVDADTLRLAADDVRTVRARLSTLVSYDGWEWASSVLEE